MLFAHTQTCLNGLISQWPWIYTFCDWGPRNKQINCACACNMVFKVFQMLS